MRKKTFSDGEWKLMNLLWEESPLTVAVMAKALADDTGWSKTAITIMLDRLEKVQAVRIDRSGRPKKFYPLISREEAMANEARSTIGRVRVDGIGMLLSAMTDTGSLTDKDIKELIALLRSKRKK